MDVNILDLASEDFPLKKVGNSVWTVDTRGSDFDTVRIWPSTNTWHRFSNGTGGGPRQWLYYIRNYDNDEIDEICGREVKKSSLLEFMGKRKVRKQATDVSYEKIIGARVYSDYIKSRGITPEVAAQFSIEVQGDNTLFPLWDYKGNRLGAIVRYAHAMNKRDRYRVYMLDNGDKPYFWPMPLLSNVNQHDILVIVESTWSTCLLTQNIMGGFSNVKVGCVLGNHVSELLVQNLGKTPCIFILDSDSGGDDMEEQLIKYLIKYKAFNAEIYRPDMQVDEMSSDQHDELFDYIYENTKYNMELA